MAEHILPPSRHNNGGEAYRRPTPEEEAGLNPQTPRRLDRRVRISCPSGVVIASRILFENGAPLTNVMRAVISLESPTCRNGRDGEFANGLAQVYITRFHNEIGRVEYLIAECLVGEEHSLGAS